jgi:hypothetical protein
VIGGILLTLIGSFKKKRPRARNGLRAVCAKMVRTAPHG